MTEPLVHIAVLNWNNAPDTIACLGSLAESTYPNAATVVLDNGSTDGSPDKIASRFPEARIIRMSENLGFAGGVNAAAEVAVEDGADYIFLLNNDATIEPDAVAKIVECAQADPTVGIAGSKVLRAEAPSTIESKGVKISLHTGRIRQIGFGAKDAAGTEEPVERAAVHGAAMLVRTKAFKEIGPMSEKFFCYFEEIDYCLRARKAGWHVINCPASRVLHKGAASFGGAFSARRIYYSARNHLLLVARHSGAFLLPVRLWWVKMLTLAMIRRAPADKRDNLKHWVEQAWRDFSDGKFGEAKYEFAQE